MEFNTSAAGGFGTTDDVYDLTRMGCGEIRINSLIRFEDLSGVIPDFQSIKTLRSPQTVGGCTLYMPYMLFVDGDRVYLPVLERFEAKDDGGYATIYKGRRSVYIPEYTHGGTVSSPAAAAGGAGIPLYRVSDPEEICIKSVAIKLQGKEARSTPQTRAVLYYDTIQYIIHEAIIHGLVQNALIRAGFPKAVPIMHEIVALTHDSKVAQLTNPMDVKEIWITMDILNGVTLQRFLRRKLTRLPTKFKRAVHQLINEKENEILILDVCFQLSCYLHVLQESLRFNHRDMKIDNAFWRYHQHSEHWKRNILVHGVGTWKCRHDFVLIDFGFGCISCGGAGGATLLGASSWFNYASPCMKYGRDMAQFLYGLNAAYSLREYISQELFDVLDRATMAVDTDCTSNTVVGQHRLFAGIEADGTPSPVSHRAPLPPRIHFHEGIYTFLEKPGVDVPGCRPKTLLQTLANYAKRYTDSFVPAAPPSSGCGTGCMGM
jgi:hypothetical protein